MTAKPAAPTTWIWEELARILTDAQYQALREGYLTQSKIYNLYRRHFPTPRPKPPQKRRKL
jgi:hypothetical protein